jgi:hypothetical protein|tara:strand:+ start:94 stop:693 length:600 start_codon:yes stop_codon:yes gene_type:complete
MDTIFTLSDDTDGDLRVNLDDLYERKKKHDLNTLATYKKILGRIHNRINTISRQQMDNQYSWFLVPEMMLGVPNYDHGACVAFCIDELRNNGFLVKYTHPNLLLISWQHWIPSYVRNEIKKKTGVNVDGYGNKIIKGSETATNKGKSQPDDPNSLLFQRSKNIPVGSKKDYKDISTYKPSGNFIYNNDLLKKIEDKSKN